MRMSLNTVMNPHMKKSTVMIANGPRYVLPVSVPVDGFWVDVAGLHINFLFPAICLVECAVSNSSVSPGAISSRAIQA